MMTKEQGNSVLEILEPYESERVFLDDLRDVFRDDYGVEMTDEELHVSACNLKAVLRFAL